MMDNSDLHASNPFGQIEAYSAVRDALNVDNPQRKPSNMYGGGRRNPGYTQEDLMAVLQAAHNMPTRHIRRRKGPSRRKATQRRRISKKRRVTRKAFA